MIHAEVYEQVKGFFLLKSIEYKQTQGGDDYLNLTLLDKTGDVEAKFWSIKRVYPHITKETALETLKLFSVVEVESTVKEYQGKKYLSIDQLKVDREGRVDVRELVPCAPLDTEEMWESLRYDFISEMEVLSWKNIVIKCLDRVEEKFKVYPAAKGMHHNVYGGLLYHVLTMLQSASGLYQVYPWLNRDLLFAGIILHDIAKVYEMEAEWGMVSDHSPEGHLLGHIVQGVILIEDVVRELRADGMEISDEDKLLLQHMVVAHHDRGEWGSPKAPQLPEAWLLHMIDNIDAKMYAIHQAYEQASEGANYTEAIRSLGGRKMYIPQPRNE